MNILDSHKIFIRGNKLSYVSLEMISYMREFHRNLTKGHRNLSVYMYPRYVARLTHKTNVINGPG